MDKRIDDEKARQPVFEADNLSERGEKSRRWWSTFALKAILSVDVHDDIEVKLLSEADVDDCCRSALAGGLTPGGLGSPFDR